MQTHFWLIKHWFSASTFVVKIRIIAKPLNRYMQYGLCNLPSKTVSIGIFEL